MNSHKYSWQQFYLHIWFPQKFLIYEENNKENLTTVTHADSKKCPSDFFST